MREQPLITTPSIATCLQHSHKTKETGGECTNNGVVGGSSTGELGWSWARHGGVGSGDGSLGLTVGDLGDNGTNRLGGRCLRLAVGDLRDNGANGLGCLRLAIGDLGNNGSGRRLGGTSLRLAIRDLRNDGAGRWLGSTSLGLTIRDLGDDSGLGSLGLAIGDLRNDRWLSDLGLAITDLGCTAATGGVDSVDVDGDALRTSALAVQVVEVTGQALVEDCWSSTAVGRESEGPVAANRETSGLTSTSLERCIELEPE